MQTVTSWEIGEDARWIYEAERREDETVRDHYVKKES